MESKERTMLDAIKDAHELIHSLLDGKRTNGEIVMALAPEASQGELIPCLALAAHLVSGLTQATKDLHLTLAAVEALNTGSFLADKETTKEETIN